MDAVALVRGELPAAKSTLPNTYLAAATEPDGLAACVMVGPDTNDTARAEIEVTLIL